MRTRYRRPSLEGHGVTHLGVQCGDADSQSLGVGGVDEDEGGRFVGDPNERAAIFGRRLADGLVTESDVDGPSRQRRRGGAGRRAARAREENRTPDLLITSELLCRLSYPGGLGQHSAADQTITVV
jgi:hypothetical protein